MITEVQKYSIVMSSKFWFRWLIYFGPIVLVLVLFWAARMPAGLILLLGALTITAAQKQGSIDLRECYWYVGATIEESPFFNKRRCVIVVLPNGRRIAAMAQWKSRLADSSAYRMLDNDHPIRDIGTENG
jgi:hypothetical protein